MHVSQKKNAKWQKQRSNIIDVRKDVKEIDTEDVLIGAVASPYICGEYLVVVDRMAIDKSVHVFNRQTFKHVLSLGDKGQDHRK